MLLLSVSKDCVAFNSDSICFIVVTVDRISVYVESICCKFECEPPFQKLEELQLPPATKEER